MSEGMRLADEVSLTHMAFVRKPNLPAYIGAEGLCDTLQVYMIKKKFERIVVENDLS
jgi:hypothetical protein